MTLLTALVVKNSHIQAGIYFIFLNKCPKTNLKVFQYQISTTVKRSEKHLASKANFNTFLQLSCSNFRLNCVKRLKVTKILNEIKFEGSGTSYKQKPASRDNHLQNILDKLQFSCEMEKYGKVLISSFQQFFASINKTFILGGRLGTRLSFYEILRFSRPFLIS